MGFLKKECLAFLKESHVFYFNDEVLKKEILFWKSFFFFFKEKGNSEKKRVEKCIFCF